MFKIYGLHLRFTRGQRVFRATCQINRNNIFTITGLGLSQTISCTQFVLFVFNLFKGFDIESNSNQFNKLNLIETPIIVRDNIDSIVYYLSNCILHVFVCLTSAKHFLLHLEMASNKACTSECIMGFLLTILSNIDVDVDCCSSVNS